MEKVEIEKKEYEELLKFKKVSELEKVKNKIKDINNKIKSLNEEKNTLNEQKKVLVAELEQ